MHISSARRPRQASSPALEHATIPPQITPVRRLQPQPVNQRIGTSVGPRGAGAGAATEAGGSPAACVGV